MLTYAITKDVIDALSKFAGRKTRFFDYQGIYADKDNKLFVASDGDSTILYKFDLLPINKVHLTSRVDLEQFKVKTVYNLTFEDQNVFQFQTHEEIEQCANDVDFLFNDYATVKANSSTQGLFLPLDKLVQYGKFARAITGNRKAFYTTDFAYADNDLLVCRQLYSHSYSLLITHPIELKRKLVYQENF